jgi:predicted nuclease of predicted toxin-antitoxin system
MKFLIDAQLPPALAAWFIKAGHEAAALRDVGLRDAEDAQIWEYAERTGSIIVTKDEDFAALAVVRPGPTVLWIRTGNLVNRTLLAKFDAKWPELAAYLESNARVVVLR